MRYGILFAGLLLLLPTLIILHLLVAPYTKVEESFHIQAVHDILVHGFPSTLDSERINYDHFAFPGAVPRTAVGAAALAKLSQCVITLDERIDRQVLARGILGLYNAFALGVFAYGLRRSFGQTAGIWYLLFQSSQFHVIYYASRPLSNMFAFGLTTLAMRFLLLDKVDRSYAQAQGPYRLSLCLLTIAGVVFRSELAVLVGTQTLFLILTGRIHIFKTAVPAGLIGLTLGLLTTVTIDSLFWQRAPLWPEFEAFVFNVIHGQSSAWGTEPWSFYFFNALPRLLLNPLTYLLAIPVALRQPATRTPALSLLIPSFSFIALYSIQPHKEWRFILYIIPSLTAVAALGANYLWTRRSRSFFARGASYFLILSIIASFCLSNIVLLPASAANYPGAHALNALHQYQAQTSSVDSQIDRQENISVYLGNLACQTGVTRFLQQTDTQTTNWIYDKTEDESTKSTAVFWEKFDYVVVEASSDLEFRDEDETRLHTALPSSQWETVKVVEGFAGISIVRPGALADGIAEKRLLSFIGGQHAVDFYEKLRETARKLLLKGWWVELKMVPRVKVLRRVKSAV
ncbi:hypothetical protein N7478_006529 [Penicillium angulare]|uniref:uncharacterized protein n=1 Tax=Penicillium angulare TaxID=116970 RepID=UPI0025405CE0|nr:uncharacterized protein N7478_006529 [Penicillium angulare]KAJ5281157.1 hypothetical protein N7478_006529 [Penicillium angulare]